MIKVYLCLGSNLGDRNWYLWQALQLLQNRVGAISSVSRIYESQGWGTNSQKRYLNQVVGITTVHGPFDLLGICSEIEEMLGRRRSGERNEDRVIDIDILLYGDSVINAPALQVPHPRLHLRRFVLVPLNDIAGGLVHPVIRKPISILLRECPDNLFVTRFDLES